MTHMHMRVKNQCSYKSPPGTSQFIGNVQKRQTERNVRIVFAWGWE